VVGGIFHASNYIRLKALAGFDEFFDALVGGIGHPGETLRVSGLTGAIRAGLARVFGITKFRFVGQRKSACFHEILLKSRCQHEHFMQGGVGVGFVPDPDFLFLGFDGPLRGMFFGLSGTGSGD
jgi:hypothetical protein